MEKSKKSILSMLVVMMVASFVFCSGCIKPYDEPEYQEIENSETAFLIPLDEASLLDQGKLDSIAYLDLKKVAMKRVRIPHVWYQTGHRSWQGKYLSGAALITVDRSPVNRRWTMDAQTGTTMNDDSLQVESKDSVGFSIGFNCTGYITEADASTFLYWYPNRTLAQVMDDEVRARVQKFAFESCALEALNTLRAKKKFIISFIREGRKVIYEHPDYGSTLPDTLKNPTDPMYVQVNLGTIEFFKSRGITIQNVSMEGGFTYDNEKVQGAIDETIVAQNDVPNATAKYNAALKEYDRIVSEVDSLVTQRKTDGQATADSIVSLSKKAEEMGGADVYYRLELLKVEKQEASKWDGKYPQKVVVGGQSDTVPVAVE